MSDDKRSPREWRQVSTIYHQNDGSGQSKTVFKAKDGHVIEYSSLEKWIKNYGNLTGEFTRLQVELEKVREECKNLRSRLDGK